VLSNTLQRISHKPERSTYLAEGFVPTLEVYHKSDRVRQGFALVARYEPEDLLPLFIEISRSKILTMFSMGGWILTDLIFFEFKA